MSRCRPIKSNNFETYDFESSPEPEDCFTAMRRRQAAIEEGTRRFHEVMKKSIFDCVRTPVVFFTPLDTPSTRRLLQVAADTLHEREVFSELVKRRKEQAAKDNRRRLSLGFDAKKRKASDEPLVPAKRAKLASTSEEIDQTKCSDNVVVVKNEVKAEQPERNPMEYFDLNKKCWRMREVADIEEFQPIHRAEEEIDRDQPLEMNFEEINGTLHEKVKEFSADDKVLFDFAFTKLKKDFSAIRKEFFPEKSVGEIVEYYYRWKKPSLTYSSHKPNGAAKTVVKAETGSTEGRPKRAAAIMNKDHLMKLEKQAKGVMEKRARCKKDEMKNAVRREKEEKKEEKEEMKKQIRLSKKTNSLKLEKKAKKVTKPLTKKDRLSKKETSVPSKVKKISSTAISKKVRPAKKQ